MIARRPPIVNALEALRPKAQWTLAGDSYANLQWFDEIQAKPTEQEIEEKIAELNYQEEVNVYQEKRKLEYPNWEDQLDKIYHSGIDAWKTDIKVIKDKYPKQTMDATELQKRKDAAIFNLQKRNYEKASARLAQYELSAGKKEVVGTEKVWNMKTNSYVDEDIFNYIIQPLPIWVDGVRNPLVVQDEKEREEAQEVINNTPQAVIDSINN
tara:strand:+ start:129 stop:761 length:633 start_codon:yes stop_codon:yes gene_type:complete